MCFVSVISDSSPNPKQKRKKIELKGEGPSAINIQLGCRFHPRCLYKKNECTKKEPPLVEVEKDHFVAYHLKLNSAR